MHGSSGIPLRCSTTCGWKLLTSICFRAEGQMVALAGQLSLQSTARTPTQSFFISWCFTAAASGRSQMSKFHRGCPGPRPTPSSAATQVSLPTLALGLRSGLLLSAPSRASRAFTARFQVSTAFQQTRIPARPHTLTGPVPGEPPTDPAQHSSAQLSTAPPPTCPACSARGREQRAARRRPALWTLLASRPPEGSERRPAAASPGGGVGGARALRHARRFLLLLLPKMAADSAEQFCVAEERSGHCAVVDGNFLYVWGGYVSIEENEVYLPNDELWIYEMDSGLWTMHLMEGELPTSMSGSCGASINGKLYIFGGFDDKGYSNRLYYVNLRTKNGTYRWKKITNFKGQPPTPRDKLSCWVYKDRLIYFGGYGCRKHNELSDCFDVHDAFWEGQIFWGWHNDVHVFDTNTQTWSQPAIRGGDPPQPRAAHTCAVLGNKGYIFGGRVLQTRMNDLHCLNLDTWTWSGRISISGEKPKDRSWHTLTPIGDDRLFLFGGLSSDNVPLSDGWIHSITTNGWKQLTHLPKSRPRLWHTACLGKEGEVMVFGGSKDDLHFMDTGHCSDLLIFQTQPYSLLRLCLDCIGKNAALLNNQIPCLPSKLLQQVLKKITFWAAVNHRQERKAETERQCQLSAT